MVKSGRWRGPVLWTTAAVIAAEPGPLWSWAGIVEFRNLELTAAGHELIPLAEP